MSTRVVRQTVTVGEGGRIQLDLPELAAGTRAEVTVTAQPSTARSNRTERLAAFDRLVASMQLDEAAASEWIRQLRDERGACEDERLAEWARAVPPRQGDDSL